MDAERLDTELELISASLLPEEEISLGPSSGRLREISVTNRESQRTLLILVGEAYPSRTSVTIELKGNDIGRETATARNSEISFTQAQNWDDQDDYPLYQLLTAHLLPLLAPDTVPDMPSSHSTEQEIPVPHHTLLTSHHLLSPTKRKNLIALASQLSLSGFSKVGHPGIYYAMGEREDLEEWTREVKSWNWLALRVRVGIEPVPGETEELEGRGKESGARGGKGRGDWSELEKIGEALDWLRKRGRERMLLDTGIGGSSSTD